MPPLDAATASATALNWYKTVREGPIGANSRCIRNTLLAVWSFDCDKNTRKQGRSLFFALSKGFYNRGFNSLVHRKLRVSEGVENLLR